MRRVLALAAASAVTVGAALALTAPTASGTTSLETGGLPPGGTVKIQTNVSSGGGGKVTTVLKGGDGNDVTTEQTVTSGCNTLQPGAISIVATPTSNGTTACYGSLGFGVDPGREGLPLSQNFLNPNTQSGEVLSIALTEQAGDVAFLGDVSLDIEAVNPVSGGKDLQVTTYFEGAVVDVLDVELGTTVVTSPPNYRVVFSLEKAADRIDITALGSTRFQLEGDTNNRQGSTFTLARFTDVVQCGEPTPASGDEGATLTLGGDGCTPEPVVFTRTGNTIEVLKEPSDATFLLEINNWLAETAQYPVPPTQIDYFDGAGVNPMDVCEGTTEQPVLPGDGDLIAGEAVGGWCVASQSFVLTGGGKMQVTETLYGEGDPKFNRI